MVKKQEKEEVQDPRFDELALLFEEFESLKEMIDRNTKLVKYMEVRLRRIEERFRIIRENKEF